MPRKKGAKNNHSHNNSQITAHVRRQPKRDMAKKGDEEIKEISEKFARLRGMKDVVFEENKYWDLIVKKATDLANAYSFKKIQTPILEQLELYKRSTGETSDIVSKEMYSFVDKNGDKIALRPEITPSLVRAYIENGMLNLPHPVKMFSFGPIFRHEKPQAGRYRQSHQFDFEIFGEESPVADFLMILIAYNIFSELQIGVEVQVNSIGCKVCRPEYIKKLTAYYKEKGNRSKLCNDCKRRLEKNPLRLLDCKEPQCIQLKEDAPPMIDYLCEDCKKKFTRLLEYLDEMSIPYNLNLQLVRGLDYYNGTVFEVWAVSEEEGKGPRAEMSLAAGGRYDGLIEYLGGRATPACGFAVGIERTIMKVKTTNIPLEKESDNIIFRKKAITLFEELRKSNFNVKQSFTRDSLKDQLEEANRINTKFTLILGQKEMNDKTILLRDMESGNQEVVDFKKIKQELQKRISS